MSLFEVRVQAGPFEIGAEQARLSALTPEVGAVVSFTGQVRDAPLLLEHYPGMAEREMEALLADARARWPLIGAIIVHRHGPLAVGEPIVLVLTASSHRRAAFEACEFLMDWLKTRAPFWKKDALGWVDARDSDEQAAARWD
ncbi:molybdenum cofactor biosynthesis protein MoaE [Sandaracinobacter neustonicus]|uniref:Molybdopterin synthase catalytic subunit n=1 Tax=Sandaracinobacter neustonicus TaxID=1715348 RepID=A0A501XFB8_9SPHN|nr:molybdenum cofactor biosynthesis protein MoaE [Sandaracinobacter neustonicus]TPE59027.1 molybdenum cofactor biosynthesis protein MoaE [Sandaracinobacter neustonicus]